jgi:hypothetical protein
VVWTKAAGGLRPCQAGLRSLKSIRRTMAGLLTLLRHKPAISLA